MPTSRVALAMGVLGAVIAIVMLLPLPSPGDIYAARRWGVGAGYVGLILGFPLGIIAVPISVALHPFPAGDDARSSGVTAVIIVCITTINWTACTALLVVLIRSLRRTSRPSA